MGAVRRAAVRIDKNSFPVRKIFCKTGLYRPDNVADGVGVIKAGNADEYICFAYFLELLAYFVS